MNTRAGDSHDRDFIPSNLSDPDYFPPWHHAVPLGIQHVLAMFASNVTPALIVAGVAGLVETDRVYMVQMAMVFAGIATLMQTVGFGPVGARLPIVQGTSFAFVPVMIPIAKISGIGAVFGATAIAGVFHFFLGFVVQSIRRWLPPLVTGSVVLAIGMSLIPVGMDYAAGGVPLRGTAAYGSITNWSLAIIVIVVTLSASFLGRGLVASAATLLGILVGYVVAALFGMVDFSAFDNAGWVTWPQPLIFGFDVTLFAVFAMCLMSVVSAVETVGDVSGVAMGGAGREATGKEVAGATFADGLGSAVAGLFGGLPNTSFSQNVGLVAATGVMSRHVVTIGAIFLIVAGLIPKIGGLIVAMPSPVLGGATIVMFGMVAAAGMRLLGRADLNRRNMFILAMAFSLGLGLRAVPDVLQHIPFETLKLLMTTGLLPVALIVIVLNIIIPEEAESSDAA